MTQTVRIGIDYTSAARQRAGIGRYTRELVRALLALDSWHHYTLFAATGGLTDEQWTREKSRLQAIRDRQLAVRNIPLSDDWLARLWHRLRLPIPIELVTGRLDVLYSPDFTLPPTRLETYTLLTIHDLSFVRHPDAFLPSLRRYLEDVVPRSIERADMVLADSAHTRHDLIDLFGTPPRKVKVVTPGVDARFRPHPPSPTPAHAGAHHPGRERVCKRYGLCGERYILSVGTLQPRKNYVRLIRAFARTQASRREDGLTKSPVQLLIGGGHGWLYDDVLIEADRHDSVRVLGFVEEEDLPALYRGAALFVFPSLYEGFGLPVLEAMACGVPVVCSNTSSLPEVAGDAALLIDPTDIDGLSSAMDQALQDEGLRKTMVKRGLAQAARFTWDQAAGQLLDIITSWEER